jgi:2-methylcitrate dehydratase PrpD
MAHHYTAELAAFVADLRFDALPSEVVEHARLLALDTFGCGLLGSRTPWGRIVLEALREVEGPGDSLVWGTGVRLSAPTAALVNGTAVHGFELDDVGPGGHNGSVALTSALALADHVRGVSGKDLITAMVAGIEVAARVQECVGRKPQVRFGFHGPGLLGTFGATAAAAKTLGPNREQVVHALGHAGQQAAGLMAVQHGGMGKRLLAGKAAHSGVLAALLAARGFTNVPDIFEREYGGFCSAFCGGQPVYDLSRLVKGLGEEWFTPRVLFKMWACRVPIHPALEALRALRRDHPLPPDEVEQVTVWLDEGAVKAVGFPWTPTTITSAQLNLAYCCAVFLLENDVSIDQFREEKLADPRVLDLAARVKAVHDPGLEGGPGLGRRARVQVRLRDGTVLTAVGEVRGGPENPITRADVEAKFRKLTQATLPPAAQDRLIRTCARLETLADTVELADLLGSGAF